MPLFPTLRIGTSGNFATGVGTFYKRVLQNRDDAGLADALPRQTQRESIELCGCECQRRTRVPWPDELAVAQLSGRWPHADAVMHEHPSTYMWLALRL